MRTGIRFLGWAVLVPVFACSTHTPGSVGSDASGLPVVEVGWLPAMLASAEFRRYLDIPAGSIRLQRIPRRTLTRMAMLESFLDHADWQRIWWVIQHAPDECAGVAAINSIVTQDQNNFVGCDLDDVLADIDARGLEAAMFAHIRDEPSIPTGIFSWVGDTKGYHRNAYYACASWLAGRNKPHMAKEWRRLVRFRRNKNIRDLAVSCLKNQPGQTEAQGFARMVQRVRDTRRRLLDSPDLKRSAPELVGDSWVVRDLSTDFFAANSAPRFQVFSMTGGLVQELGSSSPSDAVPFLVRPLFNCFFRPQRSVRLRFTGRASYLDKVEELFALLEKGESGEVRMQHARFLVVAGRYRRELADAMPPYTRLGVMSRKKLLVARVLEEHVETARRVLAGHR